MPNQKLLFICLLTFLSTVSFGNHSPLPAHQDSLLNNAVALIEKGAYDDALKLNLEVFKWAEQSKNCTYQSLVGLHLARNYFYIGTGRSDFDLAIQQSNRTLTIAENCKMDSIVRRSLYLLGAMHLQAKRPDSTYHYYNRLNQLIENAGPEEASRFYSVQSAFYLEFGSDPQIEGNQNKALQYAQKAYDLAMQSKDDAAISFSNMRLGACYTSMGDHNRALETYLKSLEWATAAKNVEGQIFALGAAAGSSRTLGDATGVYQLLERRTTLQDSLYSAKSAESIANYRTLYETEKKEIELAKTNLALTKQKQQSLYILLIAVTLLAGLVIAGLYFYFKNKTKQEVALAIAKEKERTRIARELHDNVGSTVSFVVSKLDSILYRMDSEIDKKPLNQVKSSAQQAMINLRETLWTLNNPSITDIELMDKLKNYVQRYSLVPCHFEESVEDESTLSSEIVLALYRCVQEIINNINKHSQAKSLSIFFDISPANFNIRIKDDGIGFLEIQKKESYGLNNIRARMTEIGATVTIDSKINAGTTVTLNYPK